MPRRRVDDAGALLERDVIAKHRERIPFVQRMPEQHALDGTAAKGRDLPIERSSRLLGHRRRALGRDDEQLAIIRDLDVA